MDPERKAVFETPAWMGIDEIYIIGKCRGGITNIVTNTVINPLPNRDKPLIISYLLKLQGRHTEQVAICIKTPCTSVSQSQKK